MKLIRNIEVYAPEKLGVKDVLIAGGKICKIGENLEISPCLDVEVIDGTGKILLPGFIDCHVHVLGGGGEGGFANRTPEATLSGLTRYGITTVVGCLGTDGIGRHVEGLVAKVKGLNAQGITAYAYTGSYEIPVHSVTDSIVKDIMMIEEVLGVGEIAISDHRSSQPSFEAFAKVCADSRFAAAVDICRIVVVYAGFIGCHDFVISLFNVNFAGLLGKTHTSVAQGGYLVTVFIFAVFHIISNLLYRQIAIAVADVLL